MIFEPSHPEDNLPRVVVLISGNGSNLQALLDATRNQTIPARIVLVVSNRRGAYGLTRARQAGVPTLYIPFRRNADTDEHTARTRYDAQLAQHIASYDPDLIVLAGWLHIFSSAFLDYFPQRIINLHPALPGMFPGKNALAEAFVAHQRGDIHESGCMVHYVVPEVDAGPVIMQKSVPFAADDTLESYAERMHAAEHCLLIQAVRVVLNVQASTRHGGSNG